jgi:hypothetical protein
VVLVLVEPLHEAVPADGELADLTLRHGPAGVGARSPKVRRSWSCRSRHEVATAARTAVPGAHWSWEGLRDRLLELGLAEDRMAWGLPVIPVTWPAPGHSK